MILLSLVNAGETAGAIGARVAAIAWLVLVAAIALEWPRLVALALVLLGGAYAVHLSVDDVSLAATAPLVGAGLLLTAEFAYWSLEEREAVREEPGERLRRVGLLALLVLATLGAASIVLALVDVARAGGLAADLLGAGAAAAALLVVVLLARARPTP